MPRGAPPRKPKNVDVRSREYLTETEVERLMAAALGGRHGHRDAQTRQLFASHRVV